MFEAPPLSPLFCVCVCVCVHTCGTDAAETVVLFGSVRVHRGAAC
jgi:hypothetical protein